MSTENVKKNRRGISSARKTVLKFHEKDAVAIPGVPQNGLFMGHIDTIEVTKTTIKEDAQGLQSFAGKEIPRLVIRFASNHANEDDRRHYTLSFNPVESNVDTIPGGSSQWQVDNIFTWMNNLLEIFYLKNRKLTEEEENALSLTFEDYDENNNYIPVEADDVIKGYTFVFENFAAMMNGTFGTKDAEATGKPCYLSEKGNIIPIWMKLTRFQKDRKGNWRATGSNGELAFDAFYRTPLIEKIDNAKPPIKVSLDLSRESITPKEVKKAPTIGGQGAAPMAGGVMMPGGMPGAVPMGTMPGNAGAQAGEDMPF